MTSFPKVSGHCVGAIVEARMGSSRLPGKVLMDVCGVPALQRLCNRLALSETVHTIVVATTTESTDDELYDWCVKEGINVYRGSEGDVLNRVVNAAREFNIDIIVEITGDCILTDPNIVDQCVLKYLQSEADVVTNCGEQLTYPMGIYAQVFSTEELKWVDEKIDDAAVREHVSLYFYENPTRYKIVELICPSEYSQPAWRLQLDYTEDLKVLRLIYAGLEPQYGDNFGLPEICDFLRKRIEILLINQDCIEKSPR